jgi:hypothetical protein
MFISTCQKLDQSETVFLDILIFLLGYFQSLEELSEMVA